MSVYELPAAEDLQKRGSAFGAVLTVKKRVPFAELIQQTIPGRRIMAAEQRRNRSIRPSHGSAAVGVKERVRMRKEAAAHVRHRRKLPKPGDMLGAKPGDVLRSP